jgi:hypothetical protein
MNFINYELMMIMSENITLSIPLSVGETNAFRTIKRYLEDTYGGVWPNTRVVKELITKYIKSITDYKEEFA